MPLLARYDTPASLRDMPAGSPFYDNWHNHIATQLNASTPAPTAESSMTLLKRM